MSEAKDTKARYRSYPKVDFSRASETDPELIYYKLFTKRNPVNYTALTHENVEQLNVGETVKTVWLIHGWASSDTTPWYEPLKDAYLELGHNVIYVNWTKYGNLSYGMSSANVKPVGEIIANFLSKSGIPADKIHLVGHSLGSHLAAFIGKSYQNKFGEKIGRITGLDPAGPLWSHKDMTKQEKLCELDAHFVDVIHTDIQMYGYTHPCGHIDFYPNGGTNQPGYTDPNSKESSNHYCAPKFFIESIHSQVPATEIDFQEDAGYNIIITHKEKPTQITFGEHVDSKSTGIYYFETHSSSPFLKTFYPTNNDNQDT